MTSAVKRDAVYRLIVEGRDDLYSITALTTKHGWDWTKPALHVPYIDNAEGVENALNVIEITVRTYARVGIVLDADLEPFDRWTAVCQRLSTFALPLPKAPSPGGTIVEAHGKRVGVWLMPDNESPGKLENFLSVLIPSDDRCWPWAKDATLKARTDHGAEVSANDCIKAQVHTWLAWQKEPGLPFGTAITAAAFSHDAKLAGSFVDWMTRLYMW